MTLDEARTAIRALTDHDGENDDQVTDDQLDIWINLEHAMIRRRLAHIAPSLYEATDDEQTLDSDDEGLLDLPADFDSLVRVEQQIGSDWYPISVADGLQPHVSPLNVREEYDGLRLAPVSLAIGTFRIVYKQAAAIELADDADDLEVPDGFEDIIIEKCAARVRTKDADDPSPHFIRAQEVWNELKGPLRRRYGNHSVPGLRIVRGW